jgi:hypothetical protein
LCNAISKKFTKLIFLLGTLYFPKINPNKGSLEILDHCDLQLPQDESRRELKHKSKTFTDYSQTLENKDLPLGVLLRTFGTIIPECIRDGLDHSHLGRHDVGTSIDISLVCFHTLDKVSSIKIEWVECLSLHLEFDSRTKTLKLFRFPSLCLLMYRNQKGTTSLMSR